MMTQGVLPILRRQFPQNEQHAAKQTFKTFGLSEAAVDDRLKILILIPWCEHRILPGVS